MEEQKKPSTKAKAAFGLFISIIFVLLGFGLLSDLVLETSELPDFVIKGIGIFTIFVFGTMGLLHLKRLIKK